MKAATTSRWLRQWPEKSDLKATFRAAWPLSVSFMGSISLGTTDIIFIGRLGPDHLAASSLAVAVYFVVFLTGLGFVLPATPLASQARGARKPRQIRRVIRQGLWMTLTVSLPGMIILWNLPAVLRLAHQDETLITLATPYMRFFLWGLLPALGYAAMRCFLVALERPQPAMVIMWSAVSLNIFLDYVLIFGKLGFPEMGMDGAGLASFLVNLFMMLSMAGVIMFHRSFRRYTIFQRLWKPDWPTYRQFFKLGWPISLQLLSEEGMISIGTLLVGLLGPREVAAHTIALQWVGIAYMGSLGLSGAAVSRVGYHLGRKNLAGIHSASASALMLSVGFMTLVALLFYNLPYELAVLFLDPETENAGQVLKMATALILIAVFFQLFDGMQLILSGCLHGLSDMMVPSFAGLVSYFFIGLGTAVYLGFHLEWGAAGIWWGMASGLVVASIIFMIRFHILTKDDRLLA